MTFITHETMKSLTIAKDYALKEVIGLTEDDIYGFEHDVGAIIVQVKFKDILDRNKSVSVRTCGEIGFIHTRD